MPRTRTWLAGSITSFKKQDWPQRRQERIPMLTPNHYPNSLMLYKCWTQRRNLMTSSTRPQEMASQWQTKLRVQPRQRLKNLRVEPLLSSTKGSKKPSHKTTICQTLRTWIKGKNDWTQMSTSRTMKPMKILQVQTIHLNIHWATPTKTIDNQPTKKLRTVLWRHKASMMPTTDRALSRYLVAALVKAMFKLLTESLMWRR